MKHGADGAFDNCACTGCDTFRKRMTPRKESRMTAEERAKQIIYGQSGYIDIFDSMFTPEQKDWLVERIANTISEAEQSAIKQEREKIAKQLQAKAPRRFKAAIAQGFREGFERTRERAAKIADELKDRLSPICGENCAEAIRALSLEDL